MSSFEKVLYALQREMQTPKMYGWFHLLCVFITMFIIIYLIKRKNYTEKRLKTILLIYGISAFTLELLKQIVWSFNYDAGLNIVTWDYNWYAAPFQLCTTPIYVSLICIFLKKGCIRDSLLSYIAFITILGSISTLIYPESVFVTTILVNIHTMVLHLGSLIVSIYILVSREIKIDKTSLKSGYIVFLLFAFIANILNIVIYHSGVLNGETFNMFYISPYFTSVLPIFDIIQKNVPYLLFVLLYCIAIFLGELIIYSISKIIEKKAKNDVGHVS